MIRFFCHQTPKAPNLSRTIDAKFHHSILDFPFWTFRLEAIFLDVFLRHVRSSRAALFRRRGLDWLKCRFSGQSRTNGGQMFSSALNGPQEIYSNLHEILWLPICIVKLDSDFLCLLAELNARSAPPKNNGGIRGRGRFWFMSSFFKKSCEEGIFSVLSFGVAQPASTEGSLL